MSDPQSSIHGAARLGDVGLARQLLDEYPPLVNQDDEHAWPPIFHAALWKQFEMVELLIDRGADLSRHDGYVVHYAAEMPDNQSVVELLVKYGALEAHTLPGTESARQLIYALFLANDVRVTHLLDTDPTLVTARYARGDTALHHASRNGDLAAMKSLVERGADVNAVSHESHFPLYCAAGHRHVAATRYLLDQGADVGLKLSDGKTTSQWLAQFAKSDHGLQVCLDVITGAS